MDRDVMSLAISAGAAAQARVYLRAMAEAMKGVGRSLIENTGRSFEPPTSRAEQTA